MHYPNEWENTWTSDEQIKYLFARWHWFDVNDFPLDLLAEALSKDTEFYTRHISQIPAAKKYSAKYKRQIALDFKNYLMVLTQQCINEVIERQKNHADQ